MYIEHYYNIEINILNQYNNLTTITDNERTQESIIVPMPMPTRLHVHVYFYN